MSSSVHFSGRRVALPGSEREPFTAAETKSSSTHESNFASQKITVSVVVNRKAHLDVAPLIESGERLTREQLEEQYGPNAESVNLVNAFAAEHGLTVEAMPGTRTLHLTGTVEAMQKAFGTELRHVESGTHVFRVRQGAISLPAELEGHVTAVLGLDNRPAAEPHFRMIDAGKIQAHAPGVSYTPVQVGQAYNFPKNHATGQTIGIIELGGGYRPADLATYFSGLGLQNPTVTAVSVGANNAPGGSADGEVMLDIEVAGAVAQGAKIAVYFAPNTDAGFLNAIVAALHDKVNNPTVISISWGAAESKWTKQAMTAFDSAFQSAVALGITVAIASGDNGSGDNGGSGNHVDFPSSSPHVLACGGTALHATGSTIQSETVWNETAAGDGATGGGVSVMFAAPTWQTGRVATPTSGAAIPLRMRGVPDVAGDADPLTGYKVRVDGVNAVYGGTSAVAPLWAGLLATCFAQNGGHHSFVVPKLYAAPEATTFHDITVGNNGAFKATANWDACTGLGSPNGVRIEAVTASAQTAAAAS